MVQIREASRFTWMAALAGVLVMALGVLLFLQELGYVDIKMFDAMLGWIGIQWWMLILGVLFMVGLFLIALVVGAIVDPLDALPNQGLVRRVQCTSCSAVFQFEDEGKLPVTVSCPNCQRLGYYDGKSAPSGTPPAAVRQLKLACPRCDERITAASDAKVATCTNCGLEARLPSRS